MIDLRHTTTTSTVVSYSTSGERIHMQGAEQMENGQSPRQKRRPHEDFGYQRSFNSPISRIFMVQVNLYATAELNPSLSIFYSYILQANIFITHIYKSTTKCFLIAYI
jgi:hypothetical protein